MSNIYVRICETFENMKEHAETVPENSQDLYDLIAYMEEARCQGMINMSEQIRVNLLDFICNIILGTLKYTMNLPWEI